MNTIITIVGHGIVARINICPYHDTDTFRVGASAALAAIRRRGLDSFRKEVAEMVISTEWEDGYASIAEASLRSAKA